VYAYTDCTVMQTDKLERNTVVVNIKSVTKCCCTTLIDQFELLVLGLHLREMSCDTTLSLTSKACPMWPHDEPTLAENPFNCCAGGRNAQGSHRRLMELVE